VAGGSIYRRGMTWYVDAYIDGDRVRRAAGSTKHDARRLLEQLRRDASTGTRYLALGDLLEAYIRGLRARSKRNSISIAQVHAGHLERHLGPTYNVASLTLQDVEAFVTARLRTVSRAAVNGQLGVLRAALNYGVETGLLDALPCRVRKLREGRRLPRVLDAEQLARLVLAARPPFRMMILLAAHTGLRHQEILHLVGADVGLDFVRVSAKPGVGWVPKSFHERIVPVDPKGQLGRALRRDVVGYVAADAWLFPGREPGQPRVGAHAGVRDAFKAAGLYDPTTKPGLHALRRTWATRLLERTDVETLRQLGGWADLVTVQRYVSSTDERKQAAVRGLW
jgi:integrase